LAFEEKTSKTGPDQPKRGPLKGIRELVVFVGLLMKVARLKVKVETKKVYRKLFGGAEDKSGNSDMNRRRKGKGFLMKAKILLTNRVFLTRSALAMGSVAFLRWYLRFVDSLTTKVSYSSFLNLLSDTPNRISNLRVTANEFQFLLDGKAAVSRIVNVADPNVLQKLVASGLDFSAPPGEFNVLGFIWTFGYLFYMWKMFGRMSQGPQDENVGKRKDQMIEGIGLSFDDIAGQDKAKLEVSEVCNMLRDPSRYASVGARLPAGVLLVGPPGTGKTLLARVAAAEARVPFYACSASDFVEVFVGRGPARVRKLFAQAADNAPAIVFIDELDSIGRSRRMGSMNSEQESTLNQILTAMDGLDTSNNGVIVMAATNRYELLDPALLRAGRFDRIINCPLPDRAGRYAILSVHTKKLRTSADVDLDRLARLTPNTCGADLAAITNEAAIRTARRGGEEVNAEDFEDALRGFYAGRGGSIADIAGGISSWLKPFTPGAGNNEPQPTTGGSV
jgi:cell division protease FtsH